MTNIPLRGQIARKKECGMYGIRGVRCLWASFDAYPTGSAEGISASDSIVERHRGASYSGNTVIVFKKGEYPAKPTRTLIVENRGKEWYDAHKGQRVEIVGRTYFDRDTGRITYEIYSEDSGGAGVLAEEIYHPIFDIIRETAPRSFRAIQKWFAEGAAHYDGQTIDEAFAKKVVDNSMVFV